MVVQLVKDNLGAVTLAIGDGANDVGMIKGTTKEVQLTCWRKCLTSGSRSAIYPWILLFVFHGNELAPCFQRPFAFDTSITIHLNLDRRAIWKCNVHLAVIRTEKTALETVFLVLRTARNASGQTGPTPRVVWPEGARSKQSFCIFEDWSGDAVGKGVLRKVKASSDLWSAQSNVVGVFLFVCLCIFSLFSRGIELIEYFFDQSWTSGIFVVLFAERRNERTGRKTRDHMKGK